MEKEEAIKFLKIPTYKLYYLDDPADYSGLKEKEVERFEEVYSADAQKIRDALDWAMMNPNYDFNSLLPELNKTNEQIYDYLKKVHSTLNSPIKD